MERIAIYPGSFDPVTNGHLDLVHRGLKIFDRIIVTILTNPKKQFLFTLEERMQMLRASLNGAPRVEVDAFDGLLVDYAGARKASVIVRGLPTAENRDWGSDEERKKMKDTAPGHDAQVLIAHHDTVIEAEDHVIVFVINKKLIHQVERLFQVGVSFL